MRGGRISDGELYIGCERGRMAVTSGRIWMRNKMDGNGCMRCVERLRKWRKTR